MIHVIAIITATAGNRDKLLNEFKAVVPLVHEENGCIEYQPVTDADESSSQSKIGPDSYMVIEKWKSMDNLRAHAASSHMVEYGERVAHLVADRAVYVLN
ncbi:MAG: putative quinol monooxygenase [Granulosicoccus sp.]